jgi:signal transduction histidine kinase
VVVAGYIAGVVQLPGLLFTPCEEDCNIGENPWLIADVPALSVVFGIIQALSLLFAVVGGVVVLLHRWRASSHFQRRGLEPVLLLGALILTVGLVTVVANATGWSARNVLQILFFATFALVPWAFLLGLMRTRFFRTAAVGRVIERLTHNPRGVRDALAAELGDPTLEVAYWLPERGFVDPDGFPVAEPDPHRVRTQIDNEGRCVGALIHDPALCGEPELLREATAAAALAIENARLEVELRAKLEALRASRARLVEAGDAERRRLGRDLHDGAQQRLVALMIELQLARERFESDPAGARELVDSAFANAQEAVGELRDLAAGIHPAVLSQRGLAAALESLASRSKVPVELESELDERLPSAVETAAYFVVSEALTNVAKYAEATFARVEVRRENGAAVVDIRDDGVGGAAIGNGSGLNGLIDRVGVLDGTLEVDSPRGAGTLVRARFPLGGA